MACVIRLVLIKQIEKQAGVALTFYLVLIAGIFLAAELSLAVNKQFHFLNFGWGKCIATIFISALMLGSGQAIMWLDVIASIYLWLAAIFLALTSVMYY